MKKAELKTFINETEKLLLNNDFKKILDMRDYYSYAWSKETKYGPLLVRPDNDFPTKVYSIFCRFENVTKAINILRMFAGNPYSGKCNFHTFEYDDIIFQFEHFLTAIK